MKAFHFRLDQAMRWRTTQVEIEKSRVSRAVQAARRIDEEIDQQRQEYSIASAQLRDGGSNGVSTGDSLALWTAYSDRSRRRIADLEQKAAAAATAMAAQMRLLTEANRKLQLLENLKQRAKAHWQAEFSRELETFAGESFLFRLQSKNGRA